jgi:transcription antitermination factor NusA-like protein
LATVDIVLGAALTAAVVVDIVEPAEVAAATVDSTDGTRATAAVAVTAAVVAVLAATLMPAAISAGMNLSAVSCRDMLPGGAARSGGGLLLPPR